MKTPKELTKGHTIKIMNIGGTGTGKTYLSGTFPRSYFLTTEPGGMTTIAINPHLKANLVGYDEFIPTSPEDTKRVFVELNEACIRAREMAQKGEIETLVLDNMTFLAENRWIYINQYEQVFSRSGELDTRGMYGNLSRWLYNFTLMKLLSCPCHVVVNVHIKMEDEEVMARKPDKSTPLVANVLGGFRDTAPGMFSCVFYLDYVKGKDGKFKYYARTMKGNQKMAKNRYNLAEVIENVSFSTIMQAIKTSEKGG